MRLAWLPLLLLLAATGTRAAPPPPSFACDRAALIDEKLICSDAMLSAADGALGQAFAALMGATADPVRREAIRADEHAWILRRNRECGVTAHATILDADRPLAVDCFLAAYEERSVDLARMGADRTTDPGQISMPIRHTAPETDTTPAVPLDTLLLAGEEPVFAWREDGALLVLGRDTAGTPGLYLWQAGGGRTRIADAVADPERIERLCLVGGDVLLVPRAADMPLPVQLVDHGTVRLVTRASVPPALAAPCGLSGRHRVIADESGHLALSLGATDRQASEPEDRYVLIGVDGSWGRTRPPIRLDRRLGLWAEYLAGTREFVVAPDHLPGRGETAFERVWAKTGCLAFWRVAEDGAAIQGCIPFGGGANAMPRPLPSAAGLYVADRAAGLFKIEGETLERVLAGPVEAATLAPDRCHIAFARAPAAESRTRGRPVAILDVCRGG